MERLTTWVLDGLSFVGLLWIIQQLKGVLF